jgi:antitoxin component YwqK of YwqJK toxin-antitoxin module
MEMDFMAQQARLRNSFFISMLLCFSCSQQSKNAATFFTVPADDKNLGQQNGLMLYNEIAFSGTVYQLYYGTTDTAFVNSYNNGKEHGEWKKFYPNHQLHEQRFFVLGKKEGQMIAYWENGKRKLFYNFKDNEYEGTCYEWMPTGILAKEVNYKKGYEEGSQKHFFENGKIKSNYIINNGRRYGLLGTKNCINVKDSIF